MSTHKQLFDQRNQDRRASLDRKREHASFTVPHLLPPEGRVTEQALDVPYSSLAAEGINSLSSRIMSVVFPLNGQSVFEILLQQQFAPAGQDTSDIEASFRRFEKNVMDMLAPSNLRSTINLAYKHMLTVADCLVTMDDDFNFRLFRADQYVILRKYEGDWSEIIIEEMIDPSLHEDLVGIAFKKTETLSPKGIDDPKTHTGSPFGVGGSNSRFQPLYTKVVKDPKTGAVVITQEFNGEVVGETVEQTVPAYFPMRWQAIAGENWGISLIEDMFGDVRSMDSIAKGLIDGIVLNAEYRWGINPAGLTEMQDVLDSVNGDWIPAVQSDIFPLQFQNAAQVGMALQAKQAAATDMGRRFLMNAAIQPKGERVTARQVSILAQELEGQLGGVLSQAGREVQEPIIRRVIAVMVIKKLIPEAVSKELSDSDGGLKLRIRAGLEILNREAEREKLQQAIQDMRNLPEQALRVFKFEAIAKDWWESMGLESEGRIKSADELAAEDKITQQQQQAAMAQQLAGQAALLAAKQPQPTQESSQ